MTTVLQAKKRGTGKRSTLTQLRKGGWLAAVLYGYQTETMPISLDYKETAKAVLRYGYTGVFKIEVEGKQINAVLTDIQRDALKGHVKHVDFLAIDMTEELEVEIPITFIGTSAAAIMNVDYFMFNTDETADTSIKGDINNDGHFNISDAVVLQKWLINAKNADAVKWKNGDMNEDGVLDVYDLVLMKSALVTGPDKAFVTVSDISWDKENKTVTFIPVFGGNYAEDAWIGVVPKDTPTDERSADNYDMDYLYLSNIESGKTASLSTDSSEGIFELRVYADDNGGELLFCKEFGKN